PRPGPGAAALARNGVARGRPHRDLPAPRRLAGGGPRRAVAARLDAAGHHGGCAGSARARLMSIWLSAAVVLGSSCAGLTRASIGKSDSLKTMDCRVISAFTRVFRRAMPGNDGGWIAPKRTCPAQAGHVTRDLR